MNAPRQDVARGFSGRLALLRSESNLLFVLAISVGVVTGLGGVVFQWLIDQIEHLFDTATNDWLVGLGDARLIVGPVIGALVAGPLIIRYAREAKGHGVPEVIKAVATERGVIRPRVAGVKAIASAFTIGSGGSAGREGPIVQIGATFGSVIAHRFPLINDNRQMLVAAGAASGIAAVFNAPLAGVFFALEVILRTFSTRGFATVVIAAVTASGVWQTFHGSNTVLDGADFALDHPVELIFYALLGVLAGVVGWAFVKILYRLEDAFEALPVVPEWLVPALGAVGTGIMGIISIELLGPGLEGINTAVKGGFDTRLLLWLMVGKMLATSFTLGSGASGGIFSPSLFIGAMLGAAYGNVVVDLFGGLGLVPGGYAVVGMAALFASAAQAPISSILIVFELTGDFSIIVPLMIACVTATLTYSLITPDSIYMVKLRRNGVELEQDLVRQVLEETSLAAAAAPDYLAIPPETTIPRAIELLDELGELAVFVLSPDRVLLGQVSRRDLEAAAGAGTADLLSILTPDIPVGTADDSLQEGFRKLTIEGLDDLALVDERCRVIGRVSFDTIGAAQERALAARS